MKLLEAMIAWPPGTDQIKVGRWPDKTRWSDKLEFTWGACNSETHKMTDVGRTRMLFIYFNTIVVRDHVPVDAAHKAFLAIDEYRANISPDQQGADQ